MLLSLVLLKPATTDYYLVFLGVSETKKTVKSLIKNIHDNNFVAAVSKQSV